MNKWSIDLNPQYRRYTCADCGRTIAKAWHIHVKKYPYWREFHLCKGCGKKFQ